MKKIAIIILAMSSITAKAEVLTLNIGDCVLIKENKLKNYLPEEKVKDFLSQPFNEGIYIDGKIYEMELQNQRKNQRNKQYKVCVKNGERK